MKTITNPQNRRITPWMASLSLTAFIMLLAVGCASVNHLREAQDAFNQAAATENAMRIDTNPSDAVTSLGSVRSGYANALLSLEKLENSKDAAQLKSDGLLGAALTLKALTQWRLGQFDKANDTANQAKQNAGDQIYPRDLAIIYAIPGLIKTDQAYAKIIANSGSISDVKELLVGDHGAVADIDNARNEVDKDHPVQVYLLQAQLAAYRNYVVAEDLLNNHTTIEPTDPAQKKANTELKELNDKIGTSTSGKELVNYWAALCALTPP